jgi:hypothetical protein
MRVGGRAGIAIVLVAASIAAGGCGAESAPVAAAPEKCLESWNSDETAEQFGRHIVHSHDTRRAEVAMFSPVDPNANIPVDGVGGVIYAIPESDIEYGIAGLVETKLGWASMQELARDDQAALERIQGEASQSVNATLFPDGTLEPNG